MNSNPPKEYFSLAEKTKDKTVNIERVGDTMNDRRTYVAAVADVLIVMNGSVGTIDEAVKGLILEKPVLCLETSGGAAAVLSRFKRGEIQRLSINVNTELIQTFDAISGLMNYLCSKYTNNSCGEIK